MGVIICNREEAGISWNQMTKLLHESFQERLEQGLKFTCSFMTPEQFSDKTSKGIVLVAIDPISNNLLGTATVSMNKDRENLVYGYLEHLAISPDAKRQGIATKLLIRVSELSKNNGAVYLTSDTSCNADSSVQWHLKNGFKIYELESYHSTNYWSYVFVKPLSDISRFSSFRIKYHYFKSYVFIKMTRHVDGTDSLLGKLYKKLI